MEFSTKLWQRSPKSFATTIPHVALFQLDEAKRYAVVWEFDLKINKWTISFSDSEVKARVKTKLWKRSQKSFATTIPYPVLLTLDKLMDYIIIWEYDPKSGKWSLSFELNKRLDGKKK